jgi:hypothetical protein
MLREYLIHYNGRMPHQSRLHRPRTSRHSRPVMWPTCEPYAENPSSQK